MTVCTFYISTEDNKKRRLPNLSNDNLRALLIKKNNPRRDRGLTKFKHLSLNPRFDQFCAYDTQGNCYILDLDKSIYWCFKNEKNVSVVEFLQSHNKISLGYFNGLIKIFDLESGKLCGTFNGHRKTVKKISFNQICNQCISISDNIGFVWDPFTLKTLFLIEPLENSIIQETKFIPWYYKFIVHTSDNLLSVWHSGKGCLIKTFHTLEMLGSSINSFSFKKNGSAMVACGDCNKLLYLDTSSWSLQKVFVLPHSYTKLKLIEFISHPYENGNSSMVAFLTYYSELVLFDLIRGTVLTVGPVDQDYCDSLAINITGKYLFCLMGKGSICIFSNGIWNDQDIVSSKQDISEDPYHKVHSYYNEYFQKRSKNIFNIISTLGQFPSDLRPFMWRNILSLPMNITAYRDLCRKGFHHAFSNVLEYHFLPIELRFPVLRLASNLAFWCPLLQHNNCLPLMIIRFSKLFRSSPMVAFEVVATILVNYCQKWFSEFPLASKDIINYVDYAVKSYESELWNHFNKLGINKSTYVYPVMETLLAEVLAENDWLFLWDNVLTSKTDFLTLAVAAFYVVNKYVFFSCKSKEEFEFCIHNPVSTDIRILIKKAREMGRSLKFKSNFHEFAPLIKGNTYQILNDSAKLNKVFTLKSIANSENETVIEKIMEMNDTSMEERPDKKNISEIMNGLGSIIDCKISS